MKNCICYDNESKKDGSDETTKSIQFPSLQIDESTKNKKFETSQKEDGDISANTENNNFQDYLSIVQDFLNYINPFFCSDNKTNKDANLAVSFAENRPEFKKIRKYCYNNASRCSKSFYCWVNKKKSVDCQACYEKTKKFTLKPTFTKYIFHEVIKSSQTLSKLVPVEQEQSENFMFEFFESFLSFNLDICLELNQKYDLYNNKFYENFIQYSLYHPFPIASSLERPVIIAKTIAINECLKYNPDTKCNILTQIIRKICFCMKADVFDILTSVNIINALITVSIDNNLLIIESPLLYKFLFKKILISSSAIFLLKKFLFDALDKKLGSDKKLVFILEICYILSTISEEFEIFFGKNKKTPILTHLFMSAKNLMMEKMELDNFLEAREINEINVYFFIHDMQLKAEDKMKAGPENVTLKKTSKIDYAVFIFFDFYLQNKLAYFSEFEMPFFIICFLDENLGFFIENSQVFFNLCERQKFDVFEYLKKHMKGSYSVEISINLKCNLLHKFFEIIRKHDEKVEIFYKNYLIKLLEAYKAGYMQAYSFITLHNSAENHKIYNIARLFLELSKSSFGFVIELLSFLIHFPPLDEKHCVLFAARIIQELRKHLNEFDTKSACLAFMIIKNCGEKIGSNTAYSHLLDEIKNVVSGFMSNLLFTFINENTGSIQIISKISIKAFQIVLTMDLKDEYDAQNCVFLVIEFSSFMPIKNKQKIIDKFKRAVNILDYKTTLSSRVACFMAKSLGKKWLDK